MSEPVLDVFQQLAVLHALDGKSFFLTGKAGTGKSEVIKIIIRKLKEKKRRVVVTSSTGLTANQIGGTTIHQWAGLRADDIDTQTIETAIERGARQDKTIKHLHYVQVLIIDEVGMLLEYLYILNRVAQKVLGSDDPFGGIQVIVVGDFFQLPPIRKPFNDKTHPDLQGIMFAFQLDCWKQAFKTVVNLQKVYRQSQREFIQFLDRIRHAEPTPEDIAFLRSKVRPAPRRPTLEDELEDEDEDDEYAMQMRKEINIFDPVEVEVQGAMIALLSEERKRKRETEEYQKEYTAKKQARIAAWIEPVHFYPKNEQADQVNSERLRSLPGTEAYYHSIVGYTFNPELSMIRRHHLMNDARELVRVYENNPPVDHVVRLKIGAQVLLVKNIDIDLGLCNGLRGVVTGFSTSTGSIAGKDGKPGAPGFPIVEFENGRKHTIEAAEWSGDPDADIVPYFTQVPLKLAWAMSIHKSQGQSVSAAIGSLGNIFADGQAYVFLSRVRDPEGYYLIDFSPKSIRANPLVKAFYKKIEDAETEEFGDRAPCEEEQEEANPF